MIGAVRIHNRARSVRLHPAVRGATAAMTAMLLVRTTAAGAKRSPAEARRTSAIAATVTGSANAGAADTATDATRAETASLGAIAPHRPSATQALAQTSAAVTTSERPSMPAAPTPASGPAVTADGARTVAPPPPGHAYWQYGVAFTVESVASAGPICPTGSGGTNSDLAAKLAAAGCILGSGAGIAVRVGWRPTEDLYIGGAYEFSKQDPNNLYRLAILQQARVEVRHYFDTGWRVRPFATAAAGLGAYGDEWSVDTWGATAALGAGLEFEVSGTATIGLALVYRPLYLSAWVDSSTIPHRAGVAHIVGLELALEAQDRL